MQIATSYEQAIARRYPEAITIVLSKTANGTCNPITVSWCTVTSNIPPMLAISVGKTRYSLETIRQAREFVVAMPASTQAAEAILYGSNSGRNTDKLADGRSQVQPATKIDCVLLSNAVANFECRLVSELETGDHFICVGEVVAAHMNKDLNVRRLYSLGNNQTGGVAPV